MNSTRWAALIVAIGLVVPATTVACVAAQPQGCYEDD